MVEVVCLCVMIQARSLERQLDRLQGKVSEQRDTISQLKMDSSQLQRLKVWQALSNFVVVQRAAWVALL